MASPRSVVVPLDGSAYTEVALPDAAALAGRLGARLLLVRAVTVRALPGEDVERIRFEAASHARMALLDAAARVRQWYPALSVGLALPYGPAAPAVLDEAALEHAGLIVMATHGAGDRLLQPLGQLAQAVLRQTEVPVLLICSRRVLLPDARRVEATASAGSEMLPAEPPAGRSPWWRSQVRVLLPLAGTPGLTAALSFVACLGAHVPLEATLLHVWPEEDGSLSGNQRGNHSAASPLPAWPETPHRFIPRQSPVRLPAAAAPRLPRARPITGWEGEKDPGLPALAAPRPPRARPITGEHLAECAAWLETHGIPTRIEVRRGQVAEEIARTATADADLIVLSHEGGPALPWQVPATFERIANLTCLPVLVVPARTAASGKTPMPQEPGPATLN